MLKTLNQSLLENRILRRKLLFHEHNRNFASVSLTLRQEKVGIVRFGRSELCRYDAAATPNSVSDETISLIVTILAHANSMPVEVCLAVQNTQRSRVWN